MVVPQMLAARQDLQEHLLQGVESRLFIPEETPASP
jgi:hypothetical protein